MFQSNHLIGFGAGESVVTPIGTPGSIGTISVTAGSNTATIAITTTANIVLGDLVIAVFVVGSTTPRTVSSVSDGTNAYTYAFNQTSGAGNYNLEVWYKANAAAVSSGATLTATLSGTTTGGFGYGAGAVRLTGIMASPLDQTVGSGTLTTTPSVTTGSLASSNEIVFGASYNASGSPTYTEASGFSNVFNAIGVGYGGAVLSVGYKTVAATTAVTYAPTWSAAATATNTIAVSFKGN